MSHATPADLQSQASDVQQDAYASRRTAYRELVDYVVAVVEGKPTASVDVNAMCEAAKHSPAQFSALVERVESRKRAHDDYESLNLPGRHEDLKRRLALNAGQLAASQEQLTAATTAVDALEEQQHALTLESRRLEKEKRVAQERLNAALGGVLDWRAV